MCGCNNRSTDAAGRKRVHRVTFRDGTVQDFLTSAEARVAARTKGGTYSPAWVTPVKTP